MKSILVTGGAGIIGVNFVKRPLATDDAKRVVVVDAATYSATGARLAGIRPERMYFVSAAILYQWQTSDLTRQ